jgi:EAL domain-containing protein (putative c-di-GMP-specific phosphodiesterase class I)/GGDEF domain-containing protein
MLFQSGSTTVSTVVGATGDAQALPRTNPLAPTSAEPSEMFAPPPTYPGANFYPADFINSLETSIKTVISEHSSGALLLVSVTNLAMIINAYGHDTSEIVIHDLTKMIEQVMSEGDYIQRLQRDQLGVVLVNSYPEDTAIIAARIHTIVQNFGRDSFATASLHIMGVIGSVNFPAETANAHDALDKAYVAINSMQSTPYRTFESTRHEADQCRQQMGLANYLFRAFKEKRLRLAFQPIVQSSTGKIGHYEALLRLVNPTGKISSAGALIPVAEKMGMIDIVDTMVMEMVVAELRSAPNVQLAFNVSNLTTENTIWLDQLSQLIKETPQIASRMIVEITETAAQRDLRRTAYFVATLQSMGCQVALDDFGSGYTSFRQLKALSVDIVKIDGVFVKDIAHSADNQFFVKTLLDFAQGFGLETVAEFVETGEIAKTLMDMGVDYLQGYYLGKPENHRSWLNEGEYKKD